LNVPDLGQFGWTQVLTIIGFLITIGIAGFGFRTFGRWKKEKIEEKRIETAIDALALVYECRFVFENIRGWGFEYEWDDMPQREGETEDKRRTRGRVYAILKRIQARRDFFERASKMQAKCSAVFGSEMDEIFQLMHQARQEVEVSAQMLMKEPTPLDQTAANLAAWHSFVDDVWAGYGENKVGKELAEFEERMEKVCRPIVDREYGKQHEWSLGSWWRQSRQH
jgi:hypothetical protein